MTVCALMLVKDEADIVGYTIQHLLGQVDKIIVANNGSTDGTSGILADLVNDGNPIDVYDDDERGYYQDDKTTQLAQLAFEEGFDWVMPCDADEYWYAPDGRPIRDFLDGLAPDVQIVTAAMYHHIPSALDQAAGCDKCGPDAVVGTWGPDDCSCDRNPFTRIGWRKRERGTLPKVLCRTRPDLRIHMGNHSASTDGTALTIDGLVIRHYSWRTVDQYVRKIRNGEAAYAAAPERAQYGAHWRAFEGKPDEAIAGHFNAWFHSDNPAADTSLIYDPAP